MSQHEKAFPLNAPDEKKQSKVSVSKTFSRLHANFENELPITEEEKKTAAISKRKRNARLNLFPREIVIVSGLK